MKYIVYTTENKILGGKPINADGYYEDKLGNIHFYITDYDHINKRRNIYSVASYVWGAIVGAQKS